MKANYGFDAPSILRNLFFFSFLSLLLAALCFQFEKPLWFWLFFSYTAASGLSLFITACWMLYSMRVAKPRITSELIRDLHLRGDEKVLDLGCGRGILLNQAAKRVPRGRVYGVDLWLTKDQSGNRAEATLQNARIEGVEKRVELRTADLRALPFGEGSFDTVISSLALHNIPDEAGRKTALLEMLRVLKPGGEFVLLDIQYGKEYTAFLSDKALISYSKPDYSYCPPLYLIKGKRKPSDR